MSTNVQAAPNEPPRKPRPNRATRRSWGMRGQAPLGGAFRRPTVRPVRGIDQAPTQRPSSRLHGRGRHDQERRAFDARRASRRTEIAFRGMGASAAGLTEGICSMTRSLEQARERFAFPVHAQ